MFPDNYFSISFPEILGLIITVVSVALILQQLRDTRKASQLEGFLTLANKFTEISPAITFVDNLRDSEEWIQLSPEESYQFLMADETRAKYFRELSIFYETLGVMTQQGLLQKNITKESFGPVGAIRFRTLEKALEHQRQIINEGLWTGWEWIAKKYEN